MFYKHSDISLNLNIVLYLILNRKMKKFYNIFIVMLICLQMQNWRLIILKSYIVYIKLNFLPFATLFYAISKATCLNLFVIYLYLMYKKVYSCKKKSVYCYGRCSFNS